MSALEYKRCGHQICAARISEYTPPTCLRTRLAHKRKCTTLPVPQFSRARVSWRPFSPAIDHTPCTTPSKGVQQSGRALDFTITPTREKPHCYQRTTHQPTNTRRQRILASPSPVSFLNYVYQLRSSSDFVPQYLFVCQLQCPSFVPQPTKSVPSNLSSTTAAASFFNLLASLLNYYFVPRLTSFLSSNNFVPQLTDCVPPLRSSPVTILLSSPTTTTSTSTTSFPT